MSFGHISISLHMSASAVAANVDMALQGHLGPVVPF